MKQPVIIDAVRTPVGKANAETGIFRHQRAEDLSAWVMNALVERTGIDPTEIEDVRWGCVQQQGEQAIDIARIAALVAGLPVTVTGVTLNRNCASSLQAINDAAVNIMAGFEDVQIAGGIEHMDHVPMTKGYDPCPSLFRRHSEAIMNMGLTAEYLAMKYRISRTEQDEFAHRSHELADRATNQGEFTSEVIPTWGHTAEGSKELMTRDQCIRSENSIAQLAALPPAFNPAGGSVTAGNASPLSVGSAGMLVMSQEKADALGLKPMARVVSMGVAGVDPSEMGIGPVPAVQRVFERTGLTWEDMECIEVNEAFAVQVLSVLKLLGTNIDRVNTRGGAIAIGHPLGASGARIATTLLHRMRDSGARYGLATMCVGQGQGVATIFENCQR